MRAKSKSGQGASSFGSSAESRTPHRTTDRVVRNTRRKPKAPTYKTAQEKLVTASSSVGDSCDGVRGAGRSRNENSPSVSEIIEILSRHPKWTETKTNLASKLRSAGVPEESIKEVSNIAIRRILESKREGTDIEIVKWTLAWEVATSYIFKDLPEGKKRRFQLYSERIGRVRLTPRERQVAFYIVWGLGNKEIADKIERGKDSVNKQVQSLRRKLGIRAVGLDDRLTTVLTLLGL